MAYATTLIVADPEMAMLQRRCASLAIQCKRYQLGETLLLAHATTARRIQFPAIVKAEFVAARELQRTLSRRLYASAEFEGARSATHLLRSECLANSSARLAQSSRGASTGHE